MESQRMKKWITGSVVVFIVAVLLGAKYLGFFAPPLSSVVQQPIQRIALVDLAGNQHTFDELKGKQPVVYFFTSWCAPCYKTLTTIEEVSNKNELNTDLVAVALDNNLDEVARMVAKTGFNGTVWIAAEGERALQQRYFGNEKRAVPYIVKLDENTNIVEGIYTLDSPAQWQAVLVAGIALSAAKQK